MRTDWKFWNRDAAMTDLKKKERLCKMGFLTNNCACPNGRWEVALAAVESMEQEMCPGKRQSPREHRGVDSESGSIQLLPEFCSNVLFCFWSSWRNVWHHFVKREKCVLHRYQILHQRKNCTVFGNILCPKGFCSWNSSLKIIFIHTVLNFSSV